MLNILTATAMDRTQFAISAAAGQDNSRDICDLGSSFQWVRVHRKKGSIRVTPKGDKLAWEVMGTGAWGISK